MMTDGAPCFYHANDLDTALCALETRVIGCYLSGENIEPRPPAPDAWKVNGFTRALMKAMGSVTPLSRAASAARFKGPRRVAYVEALDNLERFGLVKKHMILSCFLKAEVVQKLTAHPRLIRARSPEANIAFGRVIFPATPALKDAMNTWFREKYGFKAPIILSGADRDVLAAWAYDGITSVNDYVIVRVDGARFDRHVRIDALRWSHMIYRVAARKCPDVLKFFAWRLREDRNEVRVPEALITFVIDVIRASGDDDTWLGNTLIACRIIDWICDALKKAGCQSMYAADTSDDIGFAVPKPYVDLLQQLIVDAGVRFGFSFKTEVVSRDYRRFTWMQSFLVHDGRRARYVRDVRRTLSRAFVTDQKLDDVALREAWFSAVGIGGLVECGDVPILRKLYLAFLRAGRGATPAALRVWQSDYSSTEVRDVIMAERVLDGVGASQRCGTPDALTREKRLQKFSSLVSPPTFEMELAICELHGWTLDQVQAIEEHLDALDLSGDFDVLDRGVYDLGTAFYGARFI